MGFNLKSFLAEAIAPPKDIPQVKAALAAEELLARQAVQHRRIMEVIKSDPGDPTQGREPAKILQPFSQVLEGIIASPVHWSSEELVVVAKAIASRLLAGTGGFHRVHYGSLQGLYPLLAAKEVSAPVDVVIKRLWGNLPATTGTADQLLGHVGRGSQKHHGPISGPERKIRSPRRRVKRSTAPPSPPLARPTGRAKSGGSPQTGTPTSSVRSMTCWRRKRPTRPRLPLPPQPPHP